MKDQLLITLENSKNYTLAVAEAMPANDYDFKPAGAGWNFRELLHHIAYGIEWWRKNYVESVETPWNPPSVKADKTEIKKYLHDAYESLKKSISTLKTTDHVVKGFHATIDHITHHRGQAVLFLRCKGITPPEYSY
ncbi:MAG: DinB family protein [Bacteroidetes bacterium]|nr:DinB family protein [Bacteroidota bacterium]